MVSTRSQLEQQQQLMLNAEEQQAAICDAIQGSAAEVQLHSQEEWQLTESSLTPEGSPKSLVSSLQQMSPGQQHGQQQQHPQRKSALKSPRPATAEKSGHEGTGAESTPLGHAIKKRVRIHSGNNIVHVFGGSSTSSQNAIAAGGDHGDGGDTPHSWHCRRAAAFLSYKTLIRGVIDEKTNTGSKQQEEQQRHVRIAPTLLPWAAVLTILGWMVASSALIFMNKTIMVDRGFRFPFALTAMGSAASTALGWMASRSNFAQLRPHPSASETLTKLFPVAFCSAATLFLGNYAYLGLSVAFINILKALTPALTLAVSLLLGLEKPSLLVAASLALIAFGTSVATAQEASSAHFSWVGFGCFMLSILFEAIRVVFVERLLGRLRYNAIEVLVYIGPLTLLLLVTGALISEREHLVKEGLQIAGQHPYLFVAAGLVSFVVNAFSFFAIQTSSSLTFKVAGCLKNAVVVWMGVTLGDSLTGKEAAGYGLSLLGFMGYTLLRVAAPRHLKRS